MAPIEAILIKIAQIGAAFTKMAPIEAVLVKTESSSILSRFNKTA
jgi:hypothetical protein